jgi:hypothetical protein
MRDKVLAKLGRIEPRERLFTPSAVMPRFERSIQHSRDLSDELDRLWNTGSPGPVFAEGFDGASESEDTPEL